MTINDIIKRRGIKEILHFTTNVGLTGILASKAVKPRESLPKDKYLEHVYMYNCEDRSRDAAWHGYVNLSITKVNWRLFSISMFKWHSNIDGWWCILSFDPIILTHSGVFFTTTNNIYTGVKRKRGAEGLEQLFAEKVVRWEGNVVTRTQSTPSNQPTCEQAEVLYPGELSLDYIKAIYVRDDHSVYAAESIIDTFNEIPKVNCNVRPDLFED
jgi:hypothetical protein